jgi:uncharacterized membrane protein YkvI
MRFFLLLVLAIIVISSYIFGFSETIGAIYGEYPFWSTFLTILIVIYVLFLWKRDVKI